MLFLSIRLKINVGRNEVMYCGNCGSKQELNTVYCGECGSKMIQGTVQSIPNSSKGIRGKGISINFKVSKKFKVIIGAIVVLIVLGVSGVKVLEHFSSPHKIVEKFYTAIREKDVDTIENLIYSEDPMLVIDEKAILSYLEYAEENRNSMNDFRKTLIQQADAIEEAKESETNFKASEDEQDFMLTSVGKKFFVEQYKFKVTPFYVELSVNEEGTKVVYNENELGVIERDKVFLVGPLFPGKHKIQLMFESDYTTITKELPILLTKAEIYNQKNTIYESVYLDTKYIYVESDIPDFEISIDGTLTEFEPETKIGPVSEDTVVSISKSFPFGELISEEKAVGIDNYLSFNLINTDNMKEILSELLSTYAKELIIGFGAKTANSMTIINNELKERYSEQFETLYDYDYDYSMEIPVFNIGHIENFEENEEIISMTVNCSFNIVITEHKNWTKDEKDYAGSMQVEYNTSNGKWKITDTGFSTWNNMYGDSYEVKLENKQ